ncbi:response regulator [bacterium]|nr:response regulator [bacterium]
MTLDIRTFILALAGLRLFQVPLLLYVARVHRSYRPAREWALGSLLEGLGYSLVTFRGLVPDFVSILLGNGLLIAGDILFCMGCARAAGRRPSSKPGLLLLLMSLLGFSWFAYGFPSIGWRLVLFSLAILPYRAYAVVACFISTPGRMRQSLKILALVIAADQGIVLWRASYAPTFHSVLDMNAPQLAYGFGSMAYLLSTTAMVVLLSGQRLQEELATARDAAEVANRAKSTFLTTMSHELRTPLNGILGFAQILLGDRSMSVAQREGVATIQRSGEHLLTLINDILDLAKVESGKLDLQPEVFELMPMLNSLVELLAVRARAKGLALQFEARDLPERVVGDPRRLRQVLLNLLGNAIKFTDQGLVRLTVTRGLCFRVEDTGPGISAADQERLFQPFSQFGSAQKQAEGTGLGLSISRRLVELMGGRLQAQSVPGQGSCFTFELALPEVQALDRPPILKERCYPPGKRILVVDDVAENRAICRGLLAPLGFEVDQAADGPSALLRVEVSPPDLILLDLTMPGMSGLEVMARLPPDCRIPVIMVTASAFAEDRQRAQAAGCQGFLSKPVERELLLDELERLLPVAPPPSDDLWSALSEAAELGDVAAIDEALASMGQNELTGELRRLARQFDFDGLLERVERSKRC